MPIIAKDLFERRDDSVNRLKDLNIKHSKLAEMMSKESDYTYLSIRAFASQCSDALLTAIEEYLENHYD